MRRDASPEVHGASATRPRMAATTLAALGVVYGDIGTSPIYALRECFAERTQVAQTPENVLGVLSLITWSLIVLISVKYVSCVLRADNRGEGGILALLALLDPWRHDPDGRRRGGLAALGLFGAALLYGDGMLTPAISVLSAVEGLELAAPRLETFVVPATVAILVALFSLQRLGTGRVGAVFGPLILVWFLVLAGLGVHAIAARPEVLAALSPVHGARLLAEHGRVGFALLGAVFLVVTGGEALYADMGHFGAAAIRRTWFALVLPALLLNYYGQGALLLVHPEAASQPFFQLAPDRARLPLVALATLATVIASQAVISGAFSLTRQAVQLGEFPRVRIQQTSARIAGQVYVPVVNWLLLVTSVGLVLAFGSSSALAGAYGVAVSATMVVTTLLAFFVARQRWGWALLSAGAGALCFLTIDLAFFASNLLRVVRGGWLPLLVGALVFLVMTTWRRGSRLLAERLGHEAQPIHLLLDQLDREPPTRVPGTAVFMTEPGVSTPPALVHQIEQIGSLHERVVIVSVETAEVPRVREDRVHVLALRNGFHLVRLRFGFSETPDVPAGLRACGDLGLSIDPAAVTYFAVRITPIAAARSAMPAWRLWLFALLKRNATHATAYLQIPPSLVIELGIQVAI